MVKKKSLNRASLERDPAIRERIVAVSLEHPDFGTRRLARLLKTEGIVASESAIRSILLKQGLQTRKLRQQLLRTNLIVSHSAPSPSLLTQPGGEGKSDEREPEAPVPVVLPAAPDEAVKPEPEPAIPVITPAQALVDGAIKVPVPPPQARLEARPEALPQKRSGWKAGRDWWIIRAVNTALIGVAIYMGAGIALKMLDIRQIGPDLGMVSATHPEPNIQPSQNKAVPKPLEAYRAIWERNLFGVAEAPREEARHEDINADEIAVAEENIGLRLLGTVVANDPKLSYAVIDVVATHSQDVFRQKERAGEAFVERILRNHVIIKTEDGQRKRLSVDDTGFGKQGVARASSRLAVDAAEAHADEITVQLLREEIASSLSDTQLTIAKNSISPRFSDGKPDGFYVVSPGPQNILPRIGLLPGDLIMGMDGVHLQDPEDAEALFEKLADGGDFSILVQRGDRIQNLHVAIK